MGSTQPAGSPPRLGDVAHDLRGALSATAAYLDLARERLEEGQPVTADDLALVERGLQKLEAHIHALEAAAKGIPKEGTR